MLNHLKTQLILNKIRVMDYDSDYDYEHDYEREYDEFERKQHRRSVAHCLCCDLFEFELRTITERFKTPPFTFKKISPNYCVFKVPNTKHLRRVNIHFCVKTSNVWYGYDFYVPQRLIDSAARIYTRPRHFGNGYFLCNEPTKAELDIYAKIQTDANGNEYFMAEKYGVVHKVSAKELSFNEFYREKKLLDDYYHIFRCEDDEICKIVDNKFKIASRIITKHVRLYKLRKWAFRVTLDRLKRHRLVNLGFYMKIYMRRIGFFE